MIYNNSERRCTMYYFHPILLPSSSILIPNRSDAVNAICTTASVGSRFVLFFDYYAHLFYYKLCIINY